jgi:hypothetical protein
MVKGAFQPKRCLNIFFFVKQPSSCLAFNFKNAYFDVNVIQFVHGSKTAELSDFY